MPTDDRSLEIGYGPRPGLVLHRGVRLLSIALAMYAIGAAAGAVSAGLGYATTRLLYPARTESSLQLGFAVAFYAAVVLDFGALVLFLAGSGQLLRTRGSAPPQVGRMVRGHRVAAFVGFGLAIASVPLVYLGAFSCLDCGFSLPNRGGVFAAGVLLLGLGALSLLIAVLLPALAFASKGDARVVVAAAALGFAGVLGETLSAATLVTRTETNLDWIVFGGIPILNFGPLFGSVVAVSSGLMAWSYRRIAMRPMDLAGDPGLPPPHPSG